MSRAMKYGIGGVCLFLFGIIFGWVVYPMILKSQVHKQMNLREGSQVRLVWSKFPFNFTYKVWIFNVSNADEITKGAKPVLREIGPYVFEQWQEKVDLRDREEDDTIEYAFKNQWIFKPDMSNGLSGDEQVVVPHTFILASVMAAVREKATMIPIVNKAVDSIFSKPESIFVRIKAIDIMFNGLPIDCTVKDFAGAAVCSQIKENADDLINDGDDKYRFSFFGAKNDTASSKRIRVLRGVKNQMDIGVVVEYDGKPNISTWGDDYCDTFNGTDGTIFHPFLDENEDIVSFGPDICRSLSLTFEKKTKYKGLKTNRYTAFFGESNTMPSQKCYCSAPNNCLGKGVMDLHKCAGIPLVLSHPHFYQGDETYLTMVDGLSPSKEKHELYLEFEPFTGSPLLSNKRIQINIMIHKVEKFRLMKTFPDALLPLFWIEETVELPIWLIKQIKQGIMAVKIVGLVKWLMMLGGFGMCGYAGLLQFGASQKSSKSQNTNFNYNISTEANLGGAEKKLHPLRVLALQPASVPPALD